MLAYNGDVDTSEGFLRKRPVDDSQRSKLHNRIEILQSIIQAIAVERVEQADMPIVKSRHDAFNPVSAFKLPKAGDAFSVFKRPLPALEQVIVDQHPVAPRAA